MIRLMLLDLDGTLIGSDGRVAECVWNAVEAAQKAGIRLAACTGRPAAGVSLKVAERLGPRNGHVFQSGALVADPSGKTIHVAALREAAVLEIVRHARENDYSLELYTPNSLYVERKTKLIEAHAKAIGVTPLVTDLQTVARSEPVVRAQWVVPAQLRAQVEALPIEGVQLSSATSPVLTDTAFISVTREGVDKGSGAMALAAALEIDLAEVMGIGDSEGDIPMLEVVGHPLVMAAAPEAVRSAYPTLQGSVEECGVVEAFERAIATRKS